jgi:hypothetical protein
LAEIVLAITTNAIFNTVPGANAAMTAPTATPSTAGIAHTRTTSIITAPRRRCARKERMLVGTMITIEVPTQSCNRTSAGTPSAPNTSYRIGTMMPPPPMPNRPARMPVTKPPATIKSTSQASSSKGTPKSINGSLRRPEEKALERFHINRKKKPP